MIKIGDLAKICKVSTQTLRYYDAKGILKPDIIDPSTGYRFYSLDSKEKFKQILFYKKLGFSLDEIKKIQSSTDEELKGILENKKESISESIEVYGEQIKTINTLCADKKEKQDILQPLNIPFEDDPQIIGKWNLCGQLSDENDPTSLKEAVDEEICKEFVFLPGGAFVWFYCWTKGTVYIMSHKDLIPIPYRIFEQNGVRYMIMHFIIDECTDPGQNTMLLLYRQTDNTGYTERQSRINYDETDLEFVDDEDVHGEWTCIDLVKTVSDFSPDLPKTAKENLFIASISFLHRGVCLKTIYNVSRETVTFLLKFTKNYVLNDKEMTSEEYRISNIGGRDYLFVQHKSGDYTYGGLTPYWYVFERKVN